MDSPGVDPGGGAPRRLLKEQTATFDHGLVTAPNPDVDHHDASNVRSSAGALGAFQDDSESPYADKVELETWTLVRLLHRCEAAEQQARTLAEQVHELCEELDHEIFLAHFSRSSTQPEEPSTHGTITDPVPPQEAPSSPAEEPSTATDTASTPSDETDPCATADAVTDAEPSATGVGPRSSQPYILSDLGEPHLTRLIEEVDGASGWLATRLEGPARVVLLHQALPKGYSLQPDGDGAHHRIALVYRHSAPTPFGSGPRLVYRLVDCLALLTPQSTMNADLSNALELLLPQFNVIPSFMGEHALARARWREFAPATFEEVHPHVLSLGTANRQWLSMMLNSIVAIFPQYTERLEWLQKLWPLGPNKTSTASPEISSPAHDSERSASTTISELRTSTPTRLASEKPSPPPMPRQAPPETKSSPHSIRGSSAINMDSVEAVRADTRRAQETLFSWEQDSETHNDSDWVASSESDSLSSLSAPVQELARLLVEHDRHSLMRLRHLAHERGIVLLDALRQINEWAEARSQEAGLDLDTVMVEVVEEDDVVWVDDGLKELLR